MICFVFENARAAIKSEELLTGSGYLCRVIPAPSEISSSCGMMLSVDREVSSAVTELLNSKNIKFKIYER